MHKSFRSISTLQKGCIGAICIFTVACVAGQQPAPSASQPIAPTLVAVAPVATTAPAPRAQNRTATYLAAWMLNTTGETSPVFSGVKVNVTSVTTKTINGKSYQCIAASGIPNYKTTITKQIVDGLNTRQLAATDFATGVTSATVGQIVNFGQNIGYAPAQGCSAGKDGFGYWPPGPACPTDQKKEECFPLAPEPAVTACETGMSRIGAWVNGVSIFNWTDGSSYKREGVWMNEAYHFEFNDLDICPGHSAMGDYHTHSNPTCMAAQMVDTGTGHSKIYGFAADGYPIYGPWQANGELTNSCWKARDYDNPASKTGCGVAGERNCLLVDQYDISKGVVVTTAVGPKTSDMVTSMSGNKFPATSGFFLQDHYYDPTCTAQGIQYLDKHNGHDHDGLGYHYHITVKKANDGALLDVFPFYIGPRFAGKLQDSAITTCSTGAGGPPGGGPGGPPPGGPGGNAQAPSLAPVAAALNITEQKLKDALGPPPGNVAAAAKTLGITEAELRAAFEKAGIKLNKRWPSKPPPPPAGDGLLGTLLGSRQHWKKCARRAVADGCSLKDWRARRHRATRAAHEVGKVWRRKVGIGAGRRQPAIAFIKIAAAGHVAVFLPGVGFAGVNHGPAAA